MKINILLYIAIVNLFTINIYSQRSKIAAGDKKYDNYAYIDAIKTYERVAKKGYKSAEMFQKLGNSYYFNSKFEDAAKWYEELFAITSDLEPVYYYRYAQSLRSINQNEKANEMLVKFNELSGNDARGKLFMENRNFLEEIKANSGRYEIEDAGINSKYSDYGTAIYLDKIIFSSARDTGSLGQRKHTWTDQYFTNLYDVDIKKDSILGLPKKFDKNINSKFHESTPTFSKDGQTMYFTRNNYIDGKKGKDGNDVTLIKIYKATLVNDRWDEITELPFNSDNYSTAHPFLSPDEKTLYFVSDMPGTLGQSDIYKVTIKEDGSYYTPENLGNTINTPGRESFPFISNESEIYFASDGHPGLGGLDIFMAKINSDGSYGKVQNVGSNVNSPKDDFAYIIDTKTRRGYFSSNRDGGKGYDDIYKFLELRKLTCEQELYGQITDKATFEKIPDASVSLLNAKFDLIKNSNSDQNGNYTFVVECGKTYYVRAQKENYTTKEEKVTSTNENDKINLPIALEETGCKINVGDDLSKCFNIKTIYFDFNKSNITYKAVLDLEKILDVLKQYPNMILDVRSHTDSRGSAKYNNDLSQRRVKSTIKWLIDNGVDSTKLTGKGYGESLLINKCSDGVKCTDEEHQLNRRSEFIVKKL